MSAVCGKFVSKKIRKVGWRPVHRDNFQESNSFVAGSWDDEFNSISLWSVKNDNIDNQPNQADFEPTLLNEIHHIGDVTDFKFINSDIFIASSSTGSVTSYRIKPNHNVDVQKKWDKIHSLECTAVATRENEFSSVGEDGNINVVDLSTGQNTKRFENVESCATTAVTYIKHHEILTSNIRGELKVWDIRNKSMTPSCNFYLSGDQVSLMCIAKHPTQAHIVATGAEDGTLCMWDMRQHSLPVSLLSCHKSAILDAQFHPTQPDHVFTCSLDGSVWHWNGASLAAINSNQKIRCVWLNCDASKHRLEISSLLPQSYKAINSLDISANKILCASDNEAIYIIDNIGLN